MINRKLVETPVRMMNRMEEITDLICEYNEEVQKQQQEIERLNNIIKEAIEFIYENAYDEKRKYCIDDLWDEIPKLLEILNKGDDKK